MKHARIKPRKSFSENARVLIADLADSFLEKSAFVAGHPRLKERLHAMRVDGKQLRYLMEVCVDTFGSDFSGCLDELKRVLDLMGSIHDCDVQIPSLLCYLEELRQFNRHHSEVGERITTIGISRLIQELRTRRKDLFRQLAEALSSWRENNFKSRLVAAMKEGGN